MSRIGVTQGWGELLHYRTLMWTLTIRDLRVRYKQSILGVAWAVLIPLATTLVFAFVFTKAVKVDLKTGMPYVLFAYIGMVPWTFFSASLNSCVNSLTANRNLVTKVYFPREVFPFSAIGSAFIDFCVASTVLLGLIVWFHFGTDWSYHFHGTLFLVPIVFAVQVLLTAGLGMILAMANLFYRDVRQIFGVMINLWMFVTCVVYPLNTDQTFWGWIVALNPMTPIIQGYRSCIIYGQNPFTLQFAIASGMALIAFMVGYQWFRAKAYRFAEIV